MINTTMSKKKRPAKQSSNRPNNTNRSGTARDRIAQSRPAPSKRLPPSRAGSQNPPNTLWLYGIHAVTAALHNPDRRKHRFISTPKTAESIKIPQEFIKSIPQLEKLDRVEIDQICGEDTVHQGLALLVSPLEDQYVEDLIERTSSASTSTLVVLDQASDPRNIGAVMRSARAFGADAIIIQDRNSPPETGAMAKAASGALEFIPLIRVTNLARALWALKDAGYWVSGLDGYAETSIDDANISEKSVIVLGAEGTGLRRLTRETCDQTVKIPIDTDAESLNLSNAAAIALYALTRKHRQG